MASALLVVNAIHIATFCWAISRVWAPRGAWQPDYLDYPVGAVAAASYPIVFINGVTGAGEFVAAAQSNPLAVLLAILVMLALYVILTWVSVKIRTAVGGVA